MTRWFVPTKPQYRLLHKLDDEGQSRWVVQSKRELFLFSWWVTVSMPLDHKTAFQKKRLLELTERGR